MEEKKKRFTSLPSNYVTLQELQERRVKEQEQSQKEKREEEQRREFLEEQRLKEEQEMRREQEEEERELLETQKAQAIEAKNSGRSNRGKKLRNLSERNLGISIGPDMQKGGGGGCVAFGISADGGISDEGQNPEEPKHEKKKKKKWNKYSKKKTMKPTTEEGAGAGAGVLDHSQAENGHDGNQIPVEPKEDNKRVRKEEWEPKVKKEEAPTHRIRGGTRRGSKSTADEKAARASGVKMEKDNLTVTVMETARELEDLAVSDHHNQKEKNRGGSMAVRAGSGNYCGGPKLRKQRWFGDGSLMWVRKGETSDGSGIQKAEAKPKPCVS